jgi:hypothetical protein
MENNSSKNKAKSLKLGKYDTICPNCNSIQNVSKDLINDELIQCGNCESAIVNPLKFGSKTVGCIYCGGDSKLPKSIENELEVTCGNCGREIMNPNSDKFNPIICPHCELPCHVSEDLMTSRYFECPNCGGDFKNPKRKSVVKKSPEKKRIEVSDNTEKRVEISSDGPAITKSVRNGLVILGIIIAAVIITLISENSSTSSTPTYIVNTDTYAATSKTVYDEMFGYISVRDQQALSILLLSGNVKLLSQGTKVYIENAHLTYYVVRTYGSTQKLWVVSEHISEK